MIVYIYIHVNVCIYIQYIVYWAMNGSELVYSLQHHQTEQYM